MDNKGGDDAEEEEEFSDDGLWFLWNMFNYIAELSTK